MYIMLQLEASSPSHAKKMLIKQSHSSFLFQPYNCFYLLSNEP